MIFHIKKGQTFHSCNITLSYSPQLSSRIQAAAMGE